MPSVYVCDQCEKTHVKKFKIVKLNDFSTGAKDKYVCSEQCAIDFILRYRWKQYDIEGDNAGIERIITALNKITSK